MEGSKANFEHLFSTVEIEILNEYRRQYETILTTKLINNFYLDSEVLLEEDNRMIIQPYETKVKRL